MIIHLDVDWDDAILERFALVIAQQSLHFALQLNWILQGAIEDYEPELPSGERNPGYNPLYYSRCILLLQNIERVVVYGRPRSIQLQRLFEKGKITKQEYEILELHDRRYNALQIQEKEIKDTVVFGGALMYKRKIRTSCFKTKPWKTRYFCIQNTILFCYNEKGGKLVRSMPLENAKVGIPEDHKYKYTLFVENRGFHYVLRAKSKENQEEWMTELTAGSKAHGLFDATEEFLQDLSPSQRARFDFFRNERDFTRNVCDIAERLRWVSREDRKVQAPAMLAELEIPPCVYVPLVNSTDIWRRVHKSVPSAVKVFNTNERCPIIMRFVSKRGEHSACSHPGLQNVNLDVAEHLHLQFDIIEDGKQEMEAIDEELAERVAENGGSGDEGETDPLQESTHASLWHEEPGANTSSDKKHSRNPDSGKGNPQVQAFLRENLSGLPNKLANRIASRRRLSHLAKSKKAIETIPIVGAIKAISEHDEDDQSVVSVEFGSVLANKSIILGNTEESGIDAESLQRATDVVCGGSRWAEKTKELLEENVAADEGGVSEITSLMAKSNDDLRQEVFVMQMIHYYKSVFAKANLPLWLKTYRILSVSKDTGLIEVLTDATSIDGLKKSDNFPKEGGLRAYFEQAYGPREGETFKNAQKNFMHSLCAYSLCMYLLGLKDRHNGNIMISNLGHLIFIDFGFAMGMAPGHEFSFERAPFKLTKDYVEVMGGLNSACFKEFRRLFVQGFLEARKNSLIALGLVEIMMYKSNYPCFSGSRYGHGVALKKFEKRLMLRVPDSQVAGRAMQLVDKSINNFGTKFYDWFQHVDNGYAL
jgi:phosphatidylinositol 4-kinase